MLTSPPRSLPPSYPKLTRTRTLEQAWKNLTLDLCRLSCLAVKFVVVDLRATRAFFCNHLVNQSFARPFSSSFKQTRLHVCVYVHVLRVYNGPGAKVPLKRDSLFSFTWVYTKKRLNIATATAADSTAKCRRALDYQANLILIFPLFK